MLAEGGGEGGEKDGEEPHEPGEDAILSDSATSA